MRGTATESATTAEAVDITEAGLKAPNRGAVQARAAALVSALVMAEGEGMALVEAVDLVMAWAGISAAVTINARVAKRKRSAGLRFLKSHRFIGTLNSVQRGGGRLDPEIANRPVACSRT